MRPLSDTAAILSEELAESLNTPEAGPEPDLVQAWPTASKTDLLFACTWPWGKMVRRERAGDAARFGLAFHEALEAKLNRAKPIYAKIAGRHDIDLSELVERIEQGLPVLQKFLDGENTWDLRFSSGAISTEVSVAYNFIDDTARKCAPPDSRHEYPDRQPNEIPGTADLVAVVPSRSGRPALLVLDHKSGWNVGASWQPTTPGESGQLRTLALGLSRLYGVDEVIVAFFHAPKLGLPIVLADRLILGDLETHRKNLRKAFSNIGSRWMAPGEWCPQCPAWTICPTQASALVELKRGPGPLTAERVGAIHQATALYDQLRERLRDEIRGWVKAHGPGIRPDGKVVDIVETEATNLSQASILRALGPLKGAKEIQRLKDLGCIETRPRVELRALKR